MDRVFYGELFEDIRSTFELKWAEFKEKLSSNGDIDVSDVFDDCDSKAREVVGGYKQGGKVVRGVKQSSTLPVYEYIDNIVVDGSVQRIETFDHYVQDKMALVYWYNIIRSDVKPKYMELYFPLSRAIFLWGLNLFEGNYRYDGCMYLIRALGLMIYCIEDDDAAVPPVCEKYIERAKEERKSEILSRNGKKLWGSNHRAKEFFITLLYTHAPEHKWTKKSDAVKSLLPYVTEYIRQNYIPLSENNLYETIYGKWNVKGSKVRAALDDVIVKQKNKKPPV